MEVSKEIMLKINSRLEEFKSFKYKSEEEWFQELCFCILAANSKQKTAEQIQKSLNKELLTKNKEELAQFIQKSKHRFHNNKALFITEARKFFPIRRKLNQFNTDEEKRNWLVKNIKGIGYKEASHFLRNTGSTTLAILDRHIIRSLSEKNLIEIPKTLTPKKYLLIEKDFQGLAKSLNYTPAKLDLILWYQKTGEVAK